MHQTRQRPPTEPYEFWKARQKMQRKALKEYLKGNPIWRSNILIDTRKGIKVGPPKKTDLKSVVLQGTFVKERCVFCGEKDKRSKCKCWKLIR
jgi:hypothetical protein